MKIIKLNIVIFLDCDFKFKTMKIAMLILLILVMILSPASSVMQCPGGIRKYSAYPDDVEDPSYYYDCTKTSIAVLKKCKAGEYYDKEKSRCSIFPKQFRTASRTLDFVVALF